jgi:hypothetical protein
MGAHGGPETVYNGLVCNLDSTNPKSYPGTGNTWYDTSGFANHATLSNFTGPSAGSTSGFDTRTKWMMFDRHLGDSDGTVNNVANISNSDSLDGVLCQNGMTVDFWFRETSYVCTAMTKWTSSWEIYYCSGLVFRVEGTGGSDLSTGASSSAGNWRHLVATHTGTKATFYINGAQIYTADQTVSGQNTTNGVSIGGYSSGIYASVGAIPVYRLYDRPLSAAEVLQNYLAGKSKFGL